MSSTSPLSNASGTLSHTQNGVLNGSTASSLSAEFRDLIADIEDFITSTTSLTGADLERAKQKLRTRVATARESLEDMGETIIDRSRRVATATNEYVTERPWTAVGVSAAAGFLMGFICTRRN
jgi:ElaB/YqjD/DUF883 family membrane-anchored ribosome-binding protein